MEQRLGEDGQWHRAVPMPEPFGVTWQRCWYYRMRLGQSTLVALITGWLDARVLRGVTHER